MALASHLGPWLLGTVKNTTGTTAGTIRNMGITESVQIAPIAYTDGAATQAFVLPAGAILLELYVFQSGATYTSGSSGTITVNMNGTAIGAVTITTGTAGILGINPSTLAQTALWANVGTTDAIISTTNATLTAGSGLLIAYYAVRNSDGTYVASAQNA